MSHDSTSATGGSDDSPGNAWLSRRQLLGAAGSAGIAGIGLGGLAAVARLPDDLTTIVYAKARPRPGGGPRQPRTKPVPREWHRRLQTAFDVQADLDATGVSSFLGSFVQPGRYDDPVASISIEATEDAVLGTVEELADDVPVELDVIDEIPPASDEQPTLDEAYQLPDLDRSTVPGGVACVADDAFGTLAPALYGEGQSGPFFATSNHLFGDGGSLETEHAGDPLALPSGGTPQGIGQVIRGYPLADVVQVDPTRYRPTSEIARASPGTVIGQYTKLGLADLMARGEPLEKVGAISDHTEGRIKGIDGTTCYTGEICKPGQLKWGTKQTIEDGDSGSVSYHVDPENPDRYVLVAGVNNARTWWPGMDFSWGTAGYHLEDEYGLHF